MSGDYVKSSDALQAVGEIHPLDYNGQGIVKRIKAIPAADVVEVVRCRDCKYRAEDDFCTGRGWPDQLVADDGFCEKGKRT